MLFFSELPTVDGGAPATLRIMRSTDKGATWSAPITIADLQTVGTVDPETGIGIRDASVIGAIAAGQNGVLAVTWQDSRFTGGAYDGIAFSQLDRRRPHVVGAAAHQRLSRGARAHPERGHPRRRHDRRHVLRLSQQHARSGDAAHRLLARDVEPTA